MIVMLLACNGKDVQDTDLLLEGPELTHDVPADVTEGTEVTLEVTATDDQGVGGVVLYYRTTGEEYWSSADLVGEGSAWGLAVPGDLVVSPGLEYYFKAVDEGDPAATSYLPTGNVNEPFGFAVNVEGSPLPFAEDFELSTDSEGNAEDYADDIWGLGWLSLHYGYDGFDWEVTSTSSYGGDYAAYHGKGLDGGDAMEDWLVSPPLDLSGQDRVQVTWYQRQAGDLGASTRALKASAGSPDPVEGDYVDLYTLAAPEHDDWGRSPVFDLSSMAGEERVYVAWVYEADGGADNWTIDDVVVEAYTADLSASVVWDPDPVWPGESTTLTVTVVNGVDEPAEGVTATLAVEAGAGTLDSDTVDVGTIEADGTVSFDYELSVAKDWPENAPVALDLSLSDGSTTWSYALEMIVGLPSVGRVVIDADDDTYVTVLVGVGDPDAPDWSAEIAGEELGDDGEVTFDLTDSWESLPPAADQRWFATVGSAEQLTAESFAIDFGESTYEALGPVLVLADGSGTLQLPPPPVPTLVDGSTTPRVVAPGDTVRLDLSLRNAGADTSGPVDIWLTSDEEHVSGLDETPVALTNDVWLANQRVDSSGFEFTVSEEHTDSEPLVFTVHLDDGVESWTLEHEVEVPYAVLRVIGSEVGDLLGDNDGKPDAGEDIDLELTVANSGDAATAGSMQAVLTLDADSEVSVTFDDDSDTLGTLNAGSTGNVDFELSIEEGATDGQILSLTLTLSDSSKDHVIPIELTLGARPWASFSSSDDTEGDTLDGGLDIRNGQYRTDGETFEVVFEAWNDIDPATSFFEFFVYNIGSDGYIIYRVIYQYGSATFQYYDSGFITAGSPTVTYPSDKQVMMSFDYDWWEMSSGNVYGYFGAGECASETDYFFCDHFPNGWGYYYSKELYAGHSLSW